MKKCSGCGSLLQTENEEGLGYVKKIDHDLCVRCFNIKNYSKNTCKNYEDIDFINILKTIDKDNLIVLITDVFDLNSTLLTQIRDVFKGYDIVLLVNKIDILHDYININTLFDNIKEMYREMNLNILNGTLISAKENFNIDYAIELIDTYGKNRDVFIVGVSNVGKSQFIESFLNEIGSNDNTATISHFPATTIDILRFEYKRNNVFDTPGVINRGQIIHYVNEADIKALFPKKLKQVIYQLNMGTTLFIANYVRIDFINGDKTSFKIFCSSDLPLHRRKNKETEKFIEMHRDDILIYNYIDNDIVCHNLKLNAGDELAISGLGFISVNNRVELDVYLHRGVDVIVRKPLFGRDYVK